ncbi:hypothetical protein PR202_gb25363 [Eleusine coracana subsp. coracana]|uniref:Response regulatory domain-containing protein n=1 Tax=Eleusine coracana subsp. coracana TaxID=191504 RepID=A0AAV5FNX1_ELECO|nr:hypothetical protein PR202_gb25319 [Eleusine coracana subsp. coracana]GJN36500.1 hypothetical protein PR202_gb25363 [Eleusine coracana subsp. coracana]
MLDAEPNVRMIITDNSMPEMTGYDLLKKVKESSELKQIPVIIMSSENVPTRINRCLEEGAEDFLLKPVRPSDISRISTVGCCSQRDRWLPEAAEVLASSKLHLQQTRRFFRKCFRIFDSVI